MTEWTLLRHCVSDWSQWLSYIRHCPSFELRELYFHRWLLLEPQLLPSISVSASKKLLMHTNYGWQNCQNTLHYHKTECILESVLPSDAGEDVGWRDAMLQCTVLGLGAGVYCGDSTHAGKLRFFKRYLCNHPHLLGVYYYWSLFFPPGKRRSGRAENPVDCAQYLQWYRSQRPYCGAWAVWIKRNVL